MPEPYPFLLFSLHIALQAPPAPAFTTSAGGRGGLSRGGSSASLLQPTSSFYGLASLANNGGPGSPRPSSTSSGASDVASSGGGRSLRILRDDPLKGAVVEGLTEEIVTSREQVRGVLLEYALQC